jgi:hypothetical protein
MAKRYKKADTAGINKLLSWISANPLESAIPSRMMAKAEELGYDPRDLIDSALGSVKLDKSGAKLSEDIVDILNQVYSEDKTPGKRYVIEPFEAYTKRGKEVVDALKKDVGVAVSKDFGKPTSLPDYAAIRMPWTESQKMKSIADAGHELRHSVESLIIPEVVMKNPLPYTEGHHAKGIYETSELNREVRGLEEDPKFLKEIEKQSKKSFLKVNPFQRLFSYLGPIGTLALAGSALKSGDTLGATLKAGSALDPTGVVDVIDEARTRSKIKDPREIKKVMREDKYSAMGPALSPSDIMLDQLEDMEDEEVSVEKEIEKRRKKLGYE